MDFKEFFKDVTEKDFVLKIKLRLKDMWLEPLIIGGYLYFVGQENKPSKDVKEFFHQNNSWASSQKFSFAKYENGEVWIKECGIMFEAIPEYGVPVRVKNFSGCDWQKGVLSRNSIDHNFLEDPILTFQREYPKQYDSFIKQVSKTTISGNEEEIRKRAKILLFAPYLTLLAENGYSFAINMLYFCTDSIYRSMKFPKLKMICKNGDTIDEIFKVPKDICESLKKEPDLNKWDEMRKLKKKQDISSNDMSVIKNICYNNKTITACSSILKAKYKGENIINLPELLDLLNELVLVQSISYEESLSMIKHNISSYLKIGRKPVLNARTLKQEYLLLSNMMWFERYEDAQARITSAFRKGKYINESVNGFVIRSYNNYEEIRDDAVDLKLNLFQLYFTINRDYCNLKNVKVYTIRKEVNLEEKPFGFLLISGENSKILILGENGKKLKSPDIVLAVDNWLKLYNV